jgi:hypothetical protein
MRARVTRRHRVQLLHQIIVVPARERTAAVSDGRGSDSISELSALMQSYACAQVLTSTVVCMGAAARGASTPVSVFIIWAAH